jgi:hypothetical protein
MARCKVSCPPPSIARHAGRELGCSRKAPRLHSGGDSADDWSCNGRNGCNEAGLEQGSLARTNNRDARDASGAMHGVSESGDPHVFRHAPVLSGVERGTEVRVAVEGKIRIQLKEWIDEGSCWPPTSKAPHLDEARGASVPRSRQSIQIGKDSFSSEVLI